ncbi:hypothetical protein P9112_009075 [Eukaryota sp. TZLM1-RC]
MVIIGNHYVLGDKVGSGAFGAVYKAHDRLKNRMVAVKESPHNVSNEVMIEIEVLKKLHSPHVVSYYDFIQTPENLYIVIEWCDSSVRHVISKYGVFPENTAAHCIAQVLDGLIYLHEQAVIHRDIKSANILMNHEGKVKLADFGVSALVDGTLRAESVVGTPFWMPPEVIEQAGACAQSDIWALGCTVIEILKGNPPYGHMAPMAALFRIVTDPSPPLPTDISPELTDFLNQCFKKDPRERPSASKLRTHPWLKDFPPCTGVEEEPLNVNVVEKYNNRNGDDFSDFSDLELNVTSSNQTMGHISLSTAQKLTQSVPLKTHQTMLASFAEDDLDDLQLDIGLESEEEEGIELSNALEATLAHHQRQNDSVELEFSSDESNDDQASPSFFPHSSINLLKRKVISLVQSLNSSLNHSSYLEDNEKDLISTINKLDHLFTDHTEQELSRVLVSHHGLVPLLSLIQRSSYSKNACVALMVASLKLIITVSTNSAALLRSFCLLGAIPAIISFCSPSNEFSLRKQAACFIKLLCGRDSAPLHMFVAADGLSALGNLLKPTINKDKGNEDDLVSAAVTVISALLEPSDSSAYLHELVTNTVMFSPRFEYCRLLTSSNTPILLGKILYDHSKRSFSHQVGSNHSLTLVTSLINIFDVFCHAGHAVVVRVANEELIKYWLDSIEYLEPQLQNRLLSCIKLMSLDPDTLATLQSVNTIKVLVQLLGSSGQSINHDHSHHDDVIIRERHNQVLNALFNLCKYNPYRQADAAAAGLAPFLVNFISSSSANPALKHFAIPLLCDLARCGKGVLLKIREVGAAEQLIKLLDEPVWAVQALDALSIWVSQEPKHLQPLLSENVNNLLSVLVESFQLNSTSLVLDSLLRICNASATLCRRLSDSGLNNILLALLEDSEANLTLVIMKLFTAIYRDHRRPKELLNSGFYDAVCKVLLTEKAIVVQEVALKLKRSLDCNRFL